MIASSSRGRRLLLVAASLAALVTSSVAVAQTTRDLTLYDDIKDIDPILAEFKAHYEAETGNTLNINYFSQPGEELALTLEMEARAGAMKADAVILQHNVIQELQAKYNVFEAPIQIEGINDPAIFDGIRDPAGDGSAVPTLTNFFLIVYNTANVAPEDVPTRWADLLDERWKDKIGFGDPEVTAGGVTHLWFLSEYLADTAPDYGWGFYEKVKQNNPFLASGHGSLIEMLAAGEQDVQINSITLAIARAAAGDPIGVVIPEGEGVPVTVQATAVVADSPNADVGRALAEWVISPEGVEAFAKYKGGIPIRSDVALPELPLELTFTPDDFVVLDAQWVRENREDYLKKFHDIMR